MKRLLLLGAALSATMLAAPSISLLPSASLGTVPGGSVGWGFTLSNPSSDWVLLTGSSFTGPDTYGAYVDYLGSSATLPLAGPAPESSMLTENWDALSQSGIGEFTIDPTSPAGVTITGDLVIHYSVFSQDPNSPNFDPDTATVTADATLSLPASVTATPEPAALGLVGASLLLSGGAFLRKRRQVQQQNG